jgi:hypothetical protein
VVVVELVTIVPVVLVAPAEVELVVRVMVYLLR